MKTIKLTIGQAESLRGFLGQILDEMDLAGNMSDEILDIYIQLAPDYEATKTAEEEKVRQYRFDSLVEGGELYLFVAGQANWTEQQWQQEAENVLADRIQRPQFWVLSDYEEQE